MASQLSATSDFTETLAVHAALKLALKSKHYDKNPLVGKAAAKLCADLEGEKSIYGRQLKMIGMMEKGASVAQFGRKLKISRRTLFRYLNYLEDAGIDIRLEGGKYIVAKSVLRMVRA